MYNRVNEKKQLPIYNDTIKVFLVVFLGITIFTFSAIFSRLNIDVHHQGIMFSAAMRVFNGEPLYVGNSFYYGPLVPILNAFGFFIFGKHLLVLQLMASACYGFIAILLWRIWARFLPEFLSLITVLFSFLLAPFLYWEFHPWSSVYSLLFLLLSLFFSIKWLEIKKLWPLIYVGFFATLAFWSRQTVGLVLIFIMQLVIFILSVLLYEKKVSRIKPSLFYFSGFVLPLTIGVAILFFNNSLFSWFDSCFKSRLDWAVNIAGEGAGFYQFIMTVVKSLFALFNLNFWMFLPILMLFILFRIIIMLIIDRNRVRTESAIYFVYIVFCFISWLQYYPVSEPRHHFWSALPMCAIPVIFLWRLYGQKLHPYTNKILLTSTRSINNLWVSIGGLIFLLFSITYFFEVKQRLFSGIQLDPSMRLLPAWERLSVYDTPFVNPPALRGMFGSKSQVDSMSRIHNKIVEYVDDNPLANLKSNSSWDFLAANFSEHNSPNDVPPLLLNDTPLQPEGYQLLWHETISPSFAYQLTQPGEYYLYSPIDYYSEKIKADYQFIHSNIDLVNKLDNFPTSVSLVKIQIDMQSFFYLDAVYIEIEDGSGEWTTKPINHLWGVGIIDQLGQGIVINNGKRTEKLSLPINQKLTLLIPDNGKLQYCPKLRVSLLIDGNKHFGTIANCRNLDRKN
jgi:hypothetical protein